jgi:hypothetical protein
MVPSLVFAAVCNLTCSGPTDVTSPVGGHVAQAVTDTLTGCAAFDVRIAKGRAGGTVGSVAGAACGGELGLSLDSTASPALDVTDGKVSLRLRLQSRAARGIRPPAQVYAWADSITVLSVLTPSNGRAACGPPSVPCVTFVNSDSTTSGHTSVWRVEAASPSQPPTSSISLGRSFSRELEMAVSPSVAAFRIVVHAVAQETPLVPAQPPATTPIGMYKDSSFLHGGALREVLAVIFRENTTQAQRQEAVDAVGGIVIGGTRLHTGDGYYYLRIPSAVTEDALRAVAAQLMKLPQVEGAAPLTPGVSGYLRPRDGTGWQTWDGLPNVRADMKGLMSSVAI